MIKKIILTIIVLLISTNISTAKDIRAKGDVSFESGLFSSEPDVQTKQMAINNAVVNAWKRYTSEFTTAKLNSYKKLQNYFESNLDEFVIDKVVIDQNLDISTNTFSVVASVSFNDVAIDSKLNEGNDKSGYVGGRGGKSLFNFLFLAREQGSVNEFDDRVTAKAIIEGKDTWGEEKGEDVILIGNKGKAIKSKTESEKIQLKTVTGGSTLHQSDEIKYRVYSSSDIDAATSDVLSSHDFVVTPFSEVTALCHGPNMNKLKSEFSKNDELSPELRIEVVRVAKACDPNVKYFSLATLDIRVADIDPATGNKRVSVNFRGQVWDIRSGLSRVVASIGPIQKFGLGPDSTSAATVALQEAASEGALEIVNQLNAKQLH